MGIASDILADWQASYAALLWQCEMGVDEAIGDAPLSRYDLPVETAQAPVPAAPVAAPVAPPAVPHDPVQVAQDMADQAGDVAALDQAMMAFPHCRFEQGARGPVRRSGAGGDVMVLSAAYARDEELAGTLFAGAEGDLFDKMFAAIGLGRDRMITLPIMPWRVRGAVMADDLAPMVPFMARYAALMRPRVIVLMGDPALQTALGQAGILRARGQWAEVWGIPALPMLHPADLLQRPMAKREAWADLLALEARLL